MHSDTNFNNNKERKKKKEIGEWEWVPLPRIRIQYYYYIYIFIFKRDDNGNNWSKREIQLNSYAKYEIGYCCAVCHTYIHIHIASVLKRAYLTMDQNSLHAYSHCYNIKFHFPFSLFFPSLLAHWWWCMCSYAKASE